ncbi:MULTISPECIES: DMT family transporter [unclassified Oleiphilus]|nr:MULTISPECIES: DMT family transporter [unclassified Oleiphilus]KZY63827.1 hypothetical protein A3738_01780 [Oleiphilus sp. HI0066]KZZ61404.1 hypothetical protein A3762_14420 [Oleiphilus sp. HI0125]
MQAPFAYLTIIAVWSTTPLAINWSSQTISPVAALGLRMALAVIVGLLLLAILRVRIVWTKHSIATYSYAQLGIAGAMLCVYSAAQYIPSGLISVLFALSPMISAIFAFFMLGEDNFQKHKIIAFIMALFGLILVSVDTISLSQNGLLGIALLLSGVVLYSYSGVKVQKIGFKGHPLSTTVASLLVSLPLFFIAWLLLDGDLPMFDINSRSVHAIIYLAIFGSLLGFCAYFYLLKEAGASSVAMMTLLTPALALMLGAQINNESIGVNVICGTALILSGLFLFYYKLILASPANTGQTSEDSVI